MDVKNAFLYAPVDANIYLHQPEGFEDGTNKVCKLVKSLYGLKQAPLLWNDYLDMALQKHGFVPNPQDSAVYHIDLPSGSVDLILYVDDMLFSSYSIAALDAVSNLLQQLFQTKVTDDVTFFLGLNLHITPHNFHLSGSKYVDRIISRFPLPDFPFFTSRGVEVNDHNCLSDANELQSSDPFFRIARGFG
jgi:hypothetical protein